MTTTTETDVLAELATREEKIERANAEAQAARSAFAEVQGRAEALRAELGRLYRDNPEDFAGYLIPGKSTSAAGKVKAELDSINPAEAQARAQHAQAIADSAEQSLTDWIAAHHSELVEGIEPEARAAAHEVEKRGQALAEAARQYLAVARRVDGWRGDVSRHTNRRDLRHVRYVGIERGSALVKQTEQFSEPVPSPTETE